VSNAIKYYLGAYNFVAFLFWAAYLIAFVANGFSLNDYGLWLLNIAQGLALLEILHALMKWVKSPVESTVAQVASRLLVLALIDIFSYVGFGPPVFLTGVLVVSFAWSITELVRYSLYFLALSNIQPKWLLWARYSFFILLYPIGVAGEWCIFLAPAIGGMVHLKPGAQPITIWYKIIIVLLFISYAYYFPVLYRYMWKQRKAKLN